MGALAEVLDLNASDLHVTVGAPPSIRVDGGRGAQRLRTDAAFGQEQAQPFGIAGNKTQRLNCNDFSHFAGIVNRLFQ
jgi:Tfp pilus assembly pilus retraction ATPase PilT